MSWTTTSWPEVAPSERIGLNEACSGPSESSSTMLRVSEMPEGPQLTARGNDEVA